MRFPVQLRRLTIPLVAMILFAASGCGDDQPKPPAQEAPKDQGRPETRKVRAADAVGYDGKALQKSLDKVLDQQDKRNKELQEAQEGHEASP